MLKIILFWNIRDLIVAEFSKGSTNCECSIIIRITVKTKPLGVLSKSIILLFDILNICRVSPHPPYTQIYFSATFFGHFWVP